MTRPSSERGGGEEARTADPELKKIVAALAEGFKIVDHSDGREYDGPDYWVEKCERFQLRISIDRLLVMGVIERHPTHACGWVLADKWHKAYLRSTDELGDGKLYVPE